MHQTTVRFSNDLWLTLEEECSRAGVSVAQYLREAAVARLVYEAAARGDHEFGQALEIATGQPFDAVMVRRSAPVVETALGAPAADPFVRAGLETQDAAALWAQGRQARLRAQQLRDEIARRRSERSP